MGLYQCKSDGGYMRRNSILTAVIVIYAFVFAISCPAHADDKSEAKKHFQFGLSFLETNNFESAAKEFESSVRIYPTKNGLFNLANCYLEMRRYRDALVMIQRLMHEFENKLDDVWKRDISEFEKRLDDRVVRLNIQVNVDGAAIKLGGEELGRIPLEKPIIMERGDYEISISQDGYKTKKVKLSKEDEGKITIKLVMEREFDSGTEEAVSTQTDGLPQAAEDTQAKMGGRRKLGLAPFVIASGVTVASGVATLIVDAQIENQQDFNDAKQLQTVGKALIAVTAVGLVATGVLVFFTNFKKRNKSTDTACFSMISPVPLEGGVGLTLSGRF